jgi:hypothetical protein
MEPIFSFYLTKNEKKGSKITFGGYNLKYAKKGSKIKWINIDKENTNFWSLPMTNSLKFGQKDKN